MTPARAADSSTIRAHQTIFCGMLGPETHPFSIARSARDNQMHTFVLFIAADSHALATVGIIHLNQYTSVAASLMQRPHAHVTARHLAAASPDHAV